MRHFDPFLLLNAIVFYLKASIFSTLKWFTYSINSVASIKWDTWYNQHYMYLWKILSPVSIPGNIFIYTLDTNLKSGTSITQHVTMTTRFYMSIMLLVNQPQVFL